MTRIAENGEAVLRCDGGDIDHAVDAEAAGLAEHHIGLADIVIGRTGFGETRADNDVDEAVAIDVAGRGDAETRAIAVAAAPDDETLRRSESADIKIGKTGAAINHIGLPSVSAAVVAQGRADDEVVKAVAVDVASVGNDVAEIVIGIAEDGEALIRCAVEVGEVDHLTVILSGAHFHPETVAGSVNDIGRPETAISFISADNDVVITVAIDVPGRGDVDARSVADGGALDDEALQGVQRRNIDHLAAVGRFVAKALVAAENHIGFPGVVAAVVAKKRADNDVVKAVAVDVAGGGDAVTCVIEVGVALDDEALLAGETRHIDVDRDGASENHIGFAGVVWDRGVNAAVIAGIRADDEIGEAVAVDVAGRRDAAAEPVALGVAGDDEARRRRGEVSEVDFLAPGGWIDGAETAGGSEHHIGGAGGGDAVAFFVDMRADNDIVIAVAVDVAGVGDADAGTVAGVAADDDDAFVRVQSGEFNKAVGEAGRREAFDGDALLDQQPGVSFRILIIDDAVDVYARA